MYESITLRTSITTMFSCLTEHKCVFFTWLAINCFTFNRNIGNFEDQLISYSISF